MTYMGEDKNSVTLKLPKRKLLKILVKKDGKALYELIANACMVEGP